MMESLKPLATYKTAHKIGLEEPMPMELELLTSPEPKKIWLSTPWVTFNGAPIWAHKLESF